MWSDLDSRVSVLHLVICYMSARRSRRSAITFHAGGDLWGGGGNQNLGRYYVLFLISPALPRAKFLSICLQVSLNLENRTE